jgi:hypothetical protein
MGSNVSPYPPDRPGTPDPDELIDLLRHRELSMRDTFPLLRHLVDRIEALEDRQDWLRNVVDPDAD